MNNDISYTVNAILKLDLFSRKLKHIKNYYIEVLLFCKECQFLWNGLHLFAMCDIFINKFYFL